MLILKACAVCLSTTVKLYKMDERNLRSDFNLVSGLKTSKGNGLPAYLCFECAAYVKKYKNFREKCQRANYALMEMLHRNKEIKLCNIQAIDRKKLDIMPALSFMDSKFVNCKEMKFRWTKYNRTSFSKNNIAVTHCNANSSEIEIEVPPTKQVRLSEVVKQEGPDNLDIAFEPIDYDPGDQVELDGSITNFDNTQEDVDDDYFGDFTNDFEENNGDVETFANITDMKFEIEAEVPADGSQLEEEYASMIPISMKEARAAVDVYKLFSTGKCKCQICEKGYHNEKRLKVHMRMHDKHVSGLYYCDLCHYYYKTDFLLKTHMTEKHLYKYVCRQCPEVNFDRTSAKQHFIWSHLQSESNKDANWYETRPQWLGTRGGKRYKGVVTLRPVRKMSLIPADFPKLTAVSPSDQYRLIEERKLSRNYKESEYRCELCYRGFREMVTYNKHMRKHDPSFAGPLQCDMCKLHFRNTRYMYKHMIITHLFRYSCQKCDYVCYNKGQAQQHYRWHKNVTYKCDQCDLVFKKHSTRLTHIRIKHPSTELCSLCGHSFVSQAGLYFHKRKAHTQQEIKQCDDVKRDLESELYCGECDVQFLNRPAFDTHLGSSSKHTLTNLSINNSTYKSQRRRKPPTDKKRVRLKRSFNEILNTGVATGTDCEVCGLRLNNDVQARKHYESTHPGAEFLKRYMCDVCGHTTKQYTNLLVHMRTHTREKPYPCPQCDKKFSMPSNRDRHLVVHTGEKRYECQHCHRRFTQSSAVKLHIQTVHLKIPYAPWDKKERKRRKETAIAMPKPLLDTKVGKETATVMPTPHLEPKLLVDTTGEYINAYITYNDV